MSTEQTFTTALGIEMPQITIVDVGARMEGPDRYMTLVDEGIANVVGFEPSPEDLAALLAKGHPRCRYLPYCLGRGGPGVLHVTRWPGCTSLLEPDAKVIDLFTGIGVGDPEGNFHVYRKVPVQTHRLDDIEECPQADLLKLDVQGAELDVLAGAERHLANCLVVQTEVEFVPLYKGQPLFAEMDQFLRGHGFLLHKLVDVAGRAVRPFYIPDLPNFALSQLLWSDAIFIRDFTRLEALSDEQLLKLSCILHEPYRSPDMAHHFLAEYDRRRGTQHVQSYIPFAQSLGNKLYFMNVLL